MDLLKNNDEMNHTRSYDKMAKENINNDEMKDMINKLIELDLSDEETEEHILHNISDEPNVDILDQIFQYYRKIKKPKTVNDYRIMKKDIMLDLINANLPITLYQFILYEKYYEQLLKKFGSKKLKPFHHSKQGYMSSFYVVQLFQEQGFRFE